MADNTSFEFDREKHIALNSKVYDRSSFDPETVQLVGTINFADQELATQQANLDIYRWGRDRMVSTLIEQVEAKGYESVGEVPVADVPAPPAE